MAHLLIVEDDPIAQRSLIRALHAHVCVAANDGSEALRILSMRDFDLVITDVDMPVMNGIDFYRRARERFPTLPIIFRTGSTVAGLSCLDAPIIPKDWPLSRVLDVIQRHLGFGVLPLDASQGEALSEMGGR